MKSLISLAALLLFPVFCLTSSAPALAASDKQAAAYISDVSTQAIDIIKNTALSKSEKAQKLNVIFNTSVDFPWVARFVMGRFWREASDDQRKRYVDSYQRFMVAHYSSLFSEYTGGTYKILYTHTDASNEFTVGSQIQSENGGSGEPVLIDYKVRADGQSKFKIFDVTIEGVSMLTTQRSEFSSILGSNGIDYLIEQLDKKATSIAKK